VKLPPDLERKCLALAGVTPAAKPARGKVELVEAKEEFGEALGGRAWTIPFECVNESNKRSWQARNRRAGAAWKAVRKTMNLFSLAAFEVYVQRGGTVLARFVRLGGRRLDPMVGLPASLKGVEDAVCFLLGVDDSSPQWKPTCEQVPGGKVGVRVELSVEGGR
jgi:hypothetical protein